MANPFSIQCPNCDARLKIQNPKAIGKKVRCPNCQNPFTVNAPRTSPPSDDFGDGYDDYDDDFGGGYDDYDDGFGPPRRSRSTPPPRGAARGSRGGRRKSKGRSSNNKTALIAGGAVLAFLLLVGLGFMIYSFAGGGARVDFAWLPPDSQMVVSVDVDEAWNSNLVRRFRNLDEAGVKRGLEEMEKGLREIGFAEGESVDAIDSITAGFSDAKSKKGLAVIRKKSPWDIEAIKSKNRLEEAELNGKTYYRSFSEAHYFPDPNTMIIGDKDAVEKAMERGPKSDLAERYSFLPKGDIVIGAIDNLEELTGNAPGRAIATANLKGGAMSINLTSGIEMEFLALCQDSAGAQELDKSIKNNLAESREAVKQQRRQFENMINQMPKVKDIADEGERILNDVTSSQSGDRVVVSVEIPGSLFDKIESFANDMKAGGGMPPMNPLQGFDFGKMFGRFGGGGGNPVFQAREAAERAKDKNNLKQIGIAFHNYHDTFKTFPVTSGQNSQLSWRVHILPFIDQAPLYNQFKHDEPWDSPHNKPLINKMPEIYRRPGSRAAPGKTNYVGISGPGGVMENGGGKGIRDITDGTSNTILVAEVEDHAAVTWTQPADYNYNAANPVGILGGWRDGFHALLCDGSVRFISKQINPEMLLSLFQLNDGKRIDF